MGSLLKIDWVMNHFWKSYTQINSIIWFIHHRMKTTLNGKVLQILIKTKMWNDFHFRLTSAAFTPHQLNQICLFLCGQIQFPCD